MARSRRGGMIVMVNGLDIVIMAVFMGVIGFGFFNGITKVTAAIIGIYLSTISAAAFYRPLANLARRAMPSMGLVTGEMACFFVLFLVFLVVSTTLLAHWFSDARLPRRIQILDNLGGAALGLVVSALATTLAALALAATLQALNQSVVGSARSPLLDLIRHQIEDSSLVPYFLRMAPWFLQILEPWFPGGLPPILRGV